jgi:superfamily II DNA or RNA helicase
MEEAAQIHRASLVKPAKPEGTGELLFVLTLPELFATGEFTYRPMIRTHLVSGEPRLKAIRLKTACSKRWPAPYPALLDRLIARHMQRNPYQQRDSNLPPSFSVEDAGDLLPDLLETGYLHLRQQEKSHATIPLRNGLQEMVTLELIGTESGEQILIDGLWILGDLRYPVKAPHIILNSGLMILEDRICRFDPALFPWAASLRKQGTFPIPRKQLPEFTEQFLRQARPPKIHLPEAYAFKVLHPRPAAQIALRQDKHAEEGPVAGLMLGYADQWIHPMATGSYVVSTDKRTYSFRNIEAEQELLRGFDGLPILHAHLRSHQYALEWIVAPWELADRIRDWEGRGWEVGWNGKPLQQSSHSFFEVKSSGVDWFDLQAGVQFGEETLDLPTLLKGLKSGDGFVPLQNGSMGILPPELADRLDAYRRLGGDETEDGSLRFQGAKALLLDHWLSQESDVRFDQAASTLRTRLRALGAPEAAQPRKGFSGELRGYQTEGLGWLRYLQELRIQGCLADDMGLGKTVQVLALLWDRKQAKAGPSLVVAPKSLLENWERECHRFTPEMKPMVLSGADRPKTLEDLPEADLYITSYPLLLRDIDWLRNKPFDYVILDESQAIKNAKTRTFKACRLLQGDHRLTMTGTPVENRVEDLCSQLEFLNPGLLPGGAPEGEALQRFGAALRPFLLRRTKEDVATDLPDKVEETLYVEMPPAQRKLYDELRTHYRASLASSVKDKGLGRSKIMVLEALLRLRQAACHPALVRELKRDPGSAKFDCLEELIQEILPAGHKVLVFSQFTKLLDLFAKRLKKHEIEFERLDGRVNHREPRIRRFQEDPDCGVFLISLKAGGVGLNLTAADYVILLDPWWNPAAEAQAIDRAHRIGQTKNVFAYRIVARDSIEEKILELQQKKRGLADAILTRDNSLLRALKPEDLDFLLG